MKTIESLIEGISIADARSAFYYLGRYLKQAEHYDRYKKDFFEDDYQSRPSETAKDLTFKLIDFIEDAQKKKANNFSNEEYIYWADRIYEIESKLDPEPTASQIEAASSAINEISPPSIKR